jgi:hypothetical protein
VLDPFHLAEAFDPAEHLLVRAARDERAVADGANHLGAGRPELVTGRAGGGAIEAHGDGVRTARGGRAGGRLHPGDGSDRGGRLGRGQRFHREAPADRLQGPGRNRSDDEGGIAGFDLDAVGKRVGLALGTKDAVAIRHLSTSFEARDELRPRFPSPRRPLPESRNPPWESRRGGPSLHSNLIPTLCQLSVYWR